MTRRSAILILAKALKAGERWISIRAPGHDKAQPILIRDNPDGSAKVIGGAGGSLNHLKLTHVRSAADYAQEARSKAAGAKDARKRQQERDRKDGLTEGKTKAKEVIKTQLRDEEAKFVATVGQALGWKTEDTRFPEEKFANASPGVTAKAAEQHGRELFKRATTAVQQQRTRLVQDAEARQAAGLGEVKLTGEKPEDITVQDLDPVAPTSKGFGYSTAYGERAEKAGLTKEALAEEAAAAKPAAKPRAEGAPDPAEKRKATQARIAAELDAIREPPAPPPERAVVDAKVAVELLKAEKALKATRADAKSKKKAIEGSAVPVEPKAYILETGQAKDGDIERDLENDLRTLRTRAFLDEVGRVAGGADSLGRHIGVGAYNSINSLALAAGGASLVDRSVVDVLGIAGAAQVLARRLSSDLTPEEYEQTRDAMGSYHLDSYVGKSDEALREARDWQEAAQEIEVGEASNGVELSVAQEMNGKRRDLVSAAQRTLGTALGEMEANAALTFALRSPKKDEVQASLGKTSIEHAIQQARAIGLDRGDYKVEKAGASTILTVTASGMDKLAQPVAKEDLQRVRAALDIIEGRQDEENWLPDGVARRPEQAMNVKPGTAARLAQPFTASPGSGMGRAMEDFIGGRAADGDAPADIMRDLLSEGTLQRAGDRGAFMDSLDKIAPLTDGEGKMVRAESYQDKFAELADAFVERRHGGKLAAIHKQQFPVDQTAVDALHTALAAHPDGVAAFKPVGEMTPQDQGAMRKVFAKEYGRADPAAEAMRTDLEKLDGAEPEKEVDDMFGRGVNPAWREWQGKRNELAEKLNAASMTWGKYVDSMGSPAKAYSAMQDVVRSNVLKTFADQHARLNPGAPLRVGKVPIANDLAHLDALDPKAREKRQAEHRDLVDSLRNRAGGRYAAGSVSDKLDGAREAEEAAAQSQMGLFGVDEMAPAGDDGKPARELNLGERHTIGHAAERQVAGMMSTVGSNFKPGQGPTHLFEPTMSGKFVGRQRAIKLIEHNRRTMLAQGVGSGKTSMMLGGFAHLKGKGKAKRGLFLVPSIVQGQFHGESLALLEPGKFKWHADPGAAREQRLAAYKDPSTDFSVVTHQAFRDDMLHLAAERDGVKPEAIAQRLDKMDPDARQAFMRELMHGHGIDHDYLAVDEGHNLLNRQGKENSRMANVIDGVADGMGTYVNASADPVKNDASEAFDILAKMDRRRYSDRDAFMRKYGVDTPAAKDGLQREMARHFYPGKIDPGVEADKQEVSVSLTAGQREHIAKLDDAAARARLARMGGNVDVDAMRTLSAGSFEGVDTGRHQEVARNLQQSIGILHNTALHHAVNGEASTEAVSKYAAARKGRPGVVFVRSLDRVKELTARLKQDGHRVVTLTGADSSAEKDRKKKEYSAGDHDIMVMSDAGAVGANLQHGKWLMQYDTPMTAMSHAQRRGRIHRVGQTSNVELADVIPDHPSVKRDRKRLADKYALREVLTSPLDGLDDRGVAGYLNKKRAAAAEGAQPLHPTLQPSQDADGQGGMF